MASGIEKNVEKIITTPLIKLNETSNNVKDDQNFHRADFETAITETKFGKFNILLMLITILPSFSQIFETVSMSYVLPIAQCDLNLTLEDKGILNGVTFAEFVIVRCYTLWECYQIKLHDMILIYEEARKRPLAFSGMIMSSFLWGYLCDTLGRRKIIITGYFLVGCFVLLASVSHNITVLIISKFFSGFIINGPFAAATSYLSEFHSTKLRAKIQMVRGSLVSLACVVLPLLAWAILPRNLNFTLLGYINLHSWNVFLFFCSMVPFASGTAFIFMPESPKFLMAIGKNGEALKVFQKVYAINTGKFGETYPIKRLVEETKQKQRRGIDVNAAIRNKSRNVLSNWLNQMKPIFLPPHVLKLLLACSNMFLVLMSINTLNLWLPQFFQEINDYQFNHNGNSSDFCEMLENLSVDNRSSLPPCNVNLENTSVYTNAILVGTIRIIGFGIAGLSVNILGKKTLSILMATISSFFATSLYFARNTGTVLALASLYISSAAVCQNILVTITLEMFPTTLRTIALSMHMTSGRIATIIGNVIFPLLLYAGCLPPFIFLGSLMLGCAILSLLYPNTENKPLE